jgi:hypothetical protein
MKAYKYDKRHLIYGHSSAIRDPDVLDFLKTLKVDLTEVLEIPADNFCLAYINWIKSFKSNNILGLENFPHVAYSNGTTESFDKFYLNNNGKRFRCFKGEYLYHELSWRNNCEWLYVEDAPLEKNDALVVSAPFADTGNEHSEYRKILKECEEKNINVLVDCAYYTISSKLSVDLNFSCITDVTFSLSKTFPIAHARIGIRLSKQDTDDSLFVYQKSKYNNRLGAYIGHQLINKFSPDYIVNKYTDKQFEICKTLNVQPSHTVLFGLGGDEWKEYYRGTETNRLSFHKFLHENTTQELLVRKLQ